jgi:hypothetical protein
MLVVVPVTLEGDYRRNSSESFRISANEHNNKLVAIGNQQVDRRLLQEPFVLDPCDLCRWVAVL